MKKLLKRFAEDKKGSAYVLAAFAVIPMFGFAALAVDYTNQDRIKTEIETAAETVALHLAKRVALDPNSSADELIAEGKGVLESLVAVPISYDKFSIDPATGKVQIAIHSDVDTFFMHMFGHKTLRAASQTEARFGRLNIDVAIAIDNSGSMGWYIDGVKKLDAAKDAAELLITSAADSVKDLKNSDLKFSVIPWHTHVRIDTKDMRPANWNANNSTGNWEKWIDWDGYSTGHFKYMAPYKKNGSSKGDMYYEMNGSDEWKDYDPNKITDVLPLEADGDGVDLKALKAESQIEIMTRLQAFNNLKVDWAGCFEHRAGKYRFSFDPPQEPDNWNDTKNDPDFDGDSLFVPHFAPDERDGYSNSYLYDNRGDSDNDSTLTNSDNGRVYNTAKYAEKDKDDHYLYYGRSPNYGCDTAKLQRLTDDADGIINEKADGALKKAIDSMQANGSTDLSIGLEWAMHTLTPWAPFPEGGEFKDTQKIMVFMTDGDNSVANASSYYWNYGSFGYMRDDPLDKFSGLPTTSQANSALDDATKKYCDAIKNKGVKLYFIYFGTPSSSAEAIKNYCASSPETAIGATNTTELKAAFKRIGEDIGRLRLVHYSD